MWKRAVVLVALGAVAAIGRADDPEPPGGGDKAELKKLKGTWTVSRALMRKQEVKVAAGMTYTFDGDKLTRTAGANKDGVKGRPLPAFKVKLDTKKKPYKITMTTDGGGVTQGIYKIEKGELFLATGRGKGAKAPADFKGDDVMVMVMTKEKDKK